MNSGEAIPNKFRKIHSPWLGDVDADPQCELLFPLGLPGFENHTQLLPVEIPAQRPLLYLQSLSDPAICFIALPVYVIDPAFELDLTDEERITLGLAAGTRPVIGADVLCVALLMPSNQSVQANLGAVVVINLHNRRGVQCVPQPGTNRLRLLAENGWVSPC
jgi:flagellar assembly factor FliW